MKTYMLLLGASMAVIFGCQKKSTELEPVYNPLSGIYTGQVSYFLLDDAGNVDFEHPTDTHSLKFAIDGASFDRSECGCAGAIAVDETESTAHFTSPDKACEDAGRYSNGQTWSFTNDIMGKFRFSLHGDTLKLTGIAGSTKNPVTSRKQIVAIRQRI